MVAYGPDWIDLGTLHSPQHRGYPDASSRPLPSTEGETQRDLPVTAVATGEAHCEMRLRERIAQLEKELDRKANIITTLADEVARLKDWPFSEDSLKACANF